jgi:hypothetical protein
MSTADDVRAALQAALAPFKDEQRVRGEIFAPGDSYWYHRPTLSFPPKAVRLPSEYDGGERLSLSITQLDLAAAKQKALVREWCAVLPTLSGVRTLWFHSRVSQEMFEAACAMPGLQGLYVKWSGIATLAPIAGHPTLTHFHLGGAPSATGLEALASVRHLVDLELWNVAAAGDLGFVEGMTGLKALELSGDGNSPKALKIASLAPLRALRSLERLTLSCMRLADGSLAPLADLPALKILRLANQLPMEAIAWLGGRRPDIACDLFTPSFGPVSWHACKACGRKSMHGLTGKGKPWLCEHCDADRLEKHRRDFAALVAAAAAETP